MSTLISILKIQKPTLIFIVGLLSFLLFGINNVNAVTRYSVATGNWGSTATWAATSGGAPGQSVPVAGDIAIIEGIGRTVTVAAAAACADVTVSTGAALTIGGFNFVSSGTTTISGTLTHTSTTATKTFNNIVISGGTWSNNVGETYAITNLTLAGSTINGAGTGVFNVSGALSVNSGTNTMNALTINVTGTTTVAGTLIFASTTGNKTFGAVVISGSGVWTSNAAETYPMTSLTLSGSTVNGTASGTFTVSGNMAVSSGTTNTLNGLNITVTGTTTIDGSLAFASTTGTKIFTGLTTLNSTGSWTNTAVNEAVTFRGGIVNNSATFSAGTGVYTFDTNAQALAGTLVIPSVTVTGVTLTNNGNLTVATALSGSGGLTNTATGTLNIGGTSAITTLTATAVGNIVNYNGAVQTVKATSYNNLTLSGSGAKTNTGTTVTGTLSIEGSAAPSAAPTWSGTSYTLHYKTTDAHLAGAEWTNTFAGTGGVIIANTAGAVTMNTAKIFNASVPLTISSGATLATGNFQLTLGGDFVNNGGALTAGSSPIIIAGTAAVQNIAGLTTTGAVTFSKTAGTATFTGNVNAGALTMAGLGGTLNLGAALTHTITGVWTRTNGTLNGGSSIIKFGSTVSGAVGAFTSTTGTVEWNAAGPQTIPALTYYNLTLSGSGAKTLSVGTTYQNNFATSGTPTTTAVEAMTVGGNFTIGTGTSFSASTFTHNIAGNWSNVGTFTANASTINLNGTTQSVTGATTFNNLTLGGSGTKTFINTATTNGNLILNSGVVANLGNGLTHSANTLSLGGSGQTAGSWGGTGSAASFINTTYFGASTGLLNVAVSTNPTITTSVSTLTGLNYISGSGPSAEQSYTVSGSYLIANISVTPPADYEISTGTGGAFVATNPITLTQSGGTVTTTTIYVRLKAGLAIASYNAQNIAATSSSATTKNVVASGTVSNIPFISTSIASLAGFTYMTGNGPSAEQSYTVSGSYLIGNITVTPPTDYEISTGSGGSFVATNPITLTQSGGTVSATTIYARLKAGLAVASYNAENIAATSTSAVTKNVACSGSVYIPTITTSVSSLTGLSYLTGSGPSAEQSFTVNGTNLIANISIAPPTDYEISLTTGGAFVATNPITLTQSGGTVSATTIYVRLKAGLAIASYNAENIAATSTSAVTKNVAASGSVYLPTINTSLSSLTGLSYLFGSGPSAEQSFTVAGASLIANVVVTAPTDYEISLTSGSGFQLTPITLTQSGGTVSTTTIYTRLKAGLAVGNYTAENIVITSTSASTRNVSCNGSVFTTSQTLTTTTTFTVPAGVTQILAQCWGAGGGGSTRTSTGRGGGGGGGAFASGAVAVTPSTSYAVAVGVGGAANTTGGNSSFNATSVVAAGGSGGTNNSTAPGAGGTVANSTGATRFAGGNGATGGTAFSGGGGGGAGTTGAGGTAPTDNLGTIGTGTSLNGGNGGAGINTNTNGNNGLTYGGGGGGATRTSGTRTGGSGANGLVVLSWPVITQSKATMTGFTYTYGSGPSAQQSFTVNGTGLFANITVTPSTDYEISTTSGSGFVSTPITLTQTGGVVSLTTLYVRLKTGLSVGTYNSENIALASTGLTTQNVVCDGTVSGPTITTSVSTVSNFGYKVANGPSSQQSFTVGGASLVSNITVTPSTNFEISTTSGSGFQSTPITLVQSAGVVALTTIYVRLKAGLSIATYNENIVLTATNAVTKNVACSGLVYIPTINTSVSSVTGFAYPVGYGPSNILSFTVNGTTLDDNILITPPTNFEISATGGGSFSPTTVIELPTVGGGVSPTTIYVRMIAGLPLGAVAAQNVVAFSIGATSMNVACSGTVVTAPELTLTPISINTGFTYVYATSTTPIQSFTISGANLVSGAPVVLTPSANFEISELSGVNFAPQASISLLHVATPTSLASTTIYIRMKLGLGVGTQLGTVVATSTSAADQTLSLSGTVSPAPTITTNTSFLTSFIYTVGAGPSAQQWFTVVGTNLSNSIIITPPTNYEIKRKIGGTYQSTAITLTQIGGDAADTIYVRLKAAVAQGVYPAVNLTLTSTNAAPKSVALSGSVVASNAPSILTSKTSLTGFGYLSSDGGPSSTQSFTVSGASLVANMTITPPTNYEICLTSNGTFQSTAITLTRSGTLINLTTIYVRLKSGLPAGSYSGGSIAIVSSATSVNISCVGIVFISPLITAAGGGSTCEGSPINLTSVGADIQNRFWQGPSSYYSSLQNPTITNATTSMSGTYTVTGNVVVGGNLVTNGDFESGNASFGSGYGYVVPVANALQPEGYYTVVKLPSSVHTDFTNWSDHTTGTGYQMVVNGSGTAGAVVWTQSVPVIPGASYEFKYSEQTVNITQVPKYSSELQLYVNGVPAGPVYTAPQVNYVWDSFVYNAYAGSNTILNLELINQNTALTGNDFALDDIVFQQILPATSSTVVTVNPTLPVSVTIGASSNPAYQNTPVVFTATPVNGGTAPSYQWKLKRSGVITDVGTDSPTFTTSTLLTADSVYCVLTSNVPCPSGNAATSNKIGLTITFRVNYWMGYTDTDWGKAENWTANFVPLTGDDVEYATVANFGISAMKDLWLDMDRTIGSLINATTKRLVIPAEKGLTVNNTIFTDGNPDRIYICSSTTAANGSLTFHNPSNYPASGTVEMYSKAWMNTAGVIGQGNKFNWQYFGIPLHSLTAFPTLNGSYVRQWFETGTSISNHWILLTNSSTLLPFYGYEICQENARTITFKGVLENGNFNSGILAVTFGKQGVPNALFPGQHIFANPYTAAIDIRQLIFGEGTLKTVYIYNTGTFEAWTNGGTTPASGNNTTPGEYTSVPYNLAGIADLPRQIPSMQAIFIKTLSASSESSQATLGINYNSATLQKNTIVQRAQSENRTTTDKTYTMLEVAGDTFADRMWIFTEPSCSRNFDNGWDGQKIINSSKLIPSIYAVENDGIYQVNTVNDMNNTNLSFIPGKDLTYTITVTNENIKSRYAGVYLVDAVENKVIDITESGTKYRFMADSTNTIKNRFKIATRNYDKDAPDAETLVKVFNSGMSVFVQNLSNKTGTVLLYDMAGRLMKKATIMPNGVSSVYTKLIPGAYVVKAICGTEEVSKRLIVK